MNNFINKNDLVWCCSKPIKPLINNPKSYNEPYNTWSKDKPWLKKIKSVKTNLGEILKQSEDNDILIHYFIKSMTNISIIILHPKTFKFPKITELIIKKLEKTGTIYYIKDIKMSYPMAFNLFYQLYSNEPRMKKGSEIFYKINRVGFNDDGKEYPVKIIVYSHNDPSNPINGKSATYKMELRDLYVKEDIKKTTFNEDEDRYPRGYDYIHISDTENQSYEYASIFFHKNSLKFLKKQKGWGLLEMFNTKKLIDKIKNFIYDYSVNELENLLVMSSGVLYSYGIREANDLDCLLAPSDKIKAQDIEKILVKDELDISYEGTKDWNDKWLAELNNRAKILGASSYIELITNPKYYYYFQGIKFLRLKGDLIIRYKRGRPAQFTDLLIT